MTFNDIVVTTRTRQSGFGLSGSFAGITYQGQCCLFSPFDSKISLEIIQTAALRIYVVYVGRYLEKILNVGRNDFQLFRLHYQLRDTRVELDDEDEIPYERIAERSLPWSHQERSLFLEHLAGPRWPTPATVFADLLETDPIDDSFTISPIQLADTSEEYYRHPLWHPHIGMVKSMDPADWLSYIVQRDQLKEGRLIQ